MKGIVPMFAFLAVSINGLLSQTCNTPSGNTTQYRCASQVETLGDLSVDGFFSNDLPNIFWFDSDDIINDTMPLDKNTLLETRVYYVSRACSNDTMSDRVAITVADGISENSVFSYDITEACVGGSIPFLRPSNLQGTFTQTRVSSGSGSLSINPNTGWIFVNTSAAGVYDVTHTVNASSSMMCASSTTQRVIITPGGESLNPDFEYGARSACVVDGGFAAPTILGDLGGIFSSAPEGLVIDPVSGVIDIAASTPNDLLGYQVTYSLSYGCSGSISSVSQNFTFRILAYKEADFSYGSNVFCTADRNPIPIVPSGARGDFSASQGLVFVDFNPGMINLESTPPGQYTITYTTTDTCTEDQHSETITVLKSPSTALNYNAAYCQGDSDPNPGDSFTPGGVFTVSRGGLNIDSSSGVINLAGSIAGTYTITYTLEDSGICTVNPSTQTLSIKVSSPFTDVVQEFCLADGIPTLQSLYAEGPHEQLWYDSLTAITPLDKNTDPALVSQTYYVASYSSVCDMESTRVPVAVFLYGESFPLSIATNVDSGGFVSSTNSLEANSGSSLDLWIPENFEGLVAWSGPNNFVASGKEITIAENLDRTHHGTYTATVTFPSCSETAALSFDLTVNENQQIRIAPEVYLQGAMLGSTVPSLMRDDLRSLGYLPTSSPYGDHILVPSNRFDMQIDPADNIVDWIWIELRDPNDPSVVIQGQSALLQRDGDVQNVLGGTDLEFELPSGDYYVVVKHRNHLAIMSDTPIFMTGTSQVISFRDGSASTYGGSAAQSTFGMPSGSYGMWAGDSDGDGTIVFYGANNEPSRIRDAVLLDRGNNDNLLAYKSLGYVSSDLYLDGEVKFLGSENDVTLTRTNILESPENTLNLSIFKLKTKVP